MPPQPRMRVATPQPPLHCPSGGLLRLVGDVADQVVEGEFSVVASNVSEKGGAPEPKFDPGEPWGEARVAKGRRCRHSPLPPPPPARAAACKSDNNVTLSGDDKVVRFGGSGKSYVYGTTGVSKGRATWEFRCETDINTDECLCYGCGSESPSRHLRRRSPVPHPAPRRAARSQARDGLELRVLPLALHGARLQRPHLLERLDVAHDREDPPGRPRALHAGLRRGRGLLRHQRHGPGRRVHRPRGQGGVPRRRGLLVEPRCGLHVLRGHRRRRSGGRAPARGRAPHGRRDARAAVDAQRRRAGVGARGKGRGSQCANPLWTRAHTRLPPPACAQGRRAVSGVPPPRPAAGAPASSAPGAPQQQLGGVSTALAHAGHYRAPGRLDGPEDGVPEAEDAPSTPIIVAGVPRPLGISLRPDAATAEAAYLRAPLVAPPASQLQQQPANAAPPASPPAAAVQRPYEWFIGRAGVDDSSVAGAAPVILSVQVRGGG